MSHRLHRHAGWASVAIIVALLLCLAPGARAAADPHAADGYTPFEGTKTDWHGFDRYDYFLDEQTLAIRPADDKSKGQRLCIVVVPKTPAPGSPWSWRGCYWDHQPQTEIELLKRGFHIAYISANATLKPGREWDAWYEF